jgi:hypothetical protein
MKRHVAVMFCVMGLLGAACAGSLEDPSRFEQGINQGGAQGEPDAGAPADDGTEDDGAADDGTADDGTADDGAADDGAADDGAAVVGCDEFPALMEAKCGSVGCHADIQTAAGVDLVSDDLEGRLPEREGQCDVNLPLVVPGNPEGSMLYVKLTAPTCGAKMPVGGTLSQDEIDCVANWIKGL